MKSKVNQELSKAKQLDQFYTSPDYAATFYDTIQQHVDLSAADILLEPSAGSGNFYNLMDPDKRIGLDLDPKGIGIIQQNFFEWKPSNPNSKIHTIGNPPFGKNSRLAIDFFNHAASFSESISFVIPRTFRKTSILNRLSLDFHMIYDETVPDNSFLFNNNKYDVWCAAQIWVRKKEKRKIIPIHKFSQFKDYFEIVNPEKADFAVQRVGAGAGTVKTGNILKYSPSSHFFIKQHQPNIVDEFKNLDYDSVKYNTVGNPSVSANELLELWLRSNNVLKKSQQPKNIFAELFEK